jgi:hypothetical protein
MRLPRRHGGSAQRSMLEERLIEIFDDKRAPGAPDTLYNYLREISMNTPTEGPAWYRRRWNGLGRGARAAALLAAVVAIMAVGLGVTMVLPRATGIGAGPTAQPTLMAVPSAPTGWRFAVAFGSPGEDGISVASNLLDPAPTVAVHVVCSGPDDVIVLVSTAAEIRPGENQPLQAAEFSCPGERRVEFTATGGAFRSVSAVAVRNPASIVDTNFTVSIEVPDATPTASPSR